jgi:hypothetical protein
MSPSVSLRCLLAALLLPLLAACSSITVPPVPVADGTGASTPLPGLPVEASPTAISCPLTEPVWAKPPEDAAVLSTPEYSYYFINADSTIWASAWFAGETSQYGLVSGEDTKLGWFRPAGADLEITGRRLDGAAPPLEAHVPCCYPTRFQATGLLFPAEGCWEVIARAAESELKFVVSVEPGVSQ